MARCHFIDRNIGLVHQPDTFQTVDFCLRFGIVHLERIAFVVTQHIIGRGTRIQQVHTQHAIVVIFGLIAADDACIQSKPLKEIKRIFDIKTYTFRFLFSFVWSGSGVVYRKIVFVDVRTTIK